MSPGTLIWFYRRRLRVHWMQELLAALGIAIGVALVFAVQVANSSITDSAHQMLRAIVGDATLQVAGRDPRGFDARVAEQVGALPGVATAAPIVEQRATLVRDGHRVPIDLVGLDARITALGGSATRSFLLGALVGQRGMLVPSSIAGALRLPPTLSPDAPTHVTLDVRGQRFAIPVRAVVTAHDIGSLADAFIGVTSLDYAQRLAGLPGRVTRIAVSVRPGAEAAVRRELTRLVGARLTVAPVDSEVHALEQAVTPNDQATGLFAAISALVGLLFTFNAMLLTMPERRRAIAELRIQGYGSGHVVSLVAFQALVLGAVASSVGLGLGDLLSRAAAQSPPSYLSFAFPLGTHRVVPLSTLASAWLGGLVVTCVVASSALLDLRNPHPTEAISTPNAEPGHALSSRIAMWLGIAAGALVLLATIVVARSRSSGVAGLSGTQAATIGLLGITLAAVLAVPAAFRATLRMLEPFARRLRMNSLVLALRALRATSIRSLALAATGAVAVFGSVAIEGDHRDLVNGLDRNFADYLAAGDLWLTTGGDENSLTTQSFPAAAALRRIRALPAVASARPYYGSMLDVGERRVWIIGRPPQDRDVVPPTQLDQGNLATASELIRRGGWVAVSRVLADALGTGVDGRISLPTPSGVRTYRIAATLTNLGWGPGAVVLNANDYRRAWLTDDPSAIEVTLRPGTAPAAARRAVQATLGSRTALRVQTYAQRDRQFEVLARQGLARLSQISALLLIAAALAMAAAMGAAIWQRRVPLARMRIDGFEPARLWMTLMVEAAVVLAVGCVIGATVGTYGHLLGGRWLTSSTGYPVPFAIGWLSAATTCVLVGAGALAVTTIPGAFAANASPRLGLQEP
ncbi:MAG: ABC transporter permease [Actinobacteria bacterium]|nr:ABC transporter permease [Actinomycetota bacterium]